VVLDSASLVGRPQRQTAFAGAVLGEDVFRGAPKLPPFHHKSVSASSNCRIATNVVVVHLDLWLLPAQPAMILLCSGRRDRPPQPRGLVLDRNVPRRRRRHPCSAPCMGHFLRAGGACIRPIYAQVEVPPAVSPHLCLQAHLTCRPACISRCSSLTRGSPGRWSHPLRGGGRG